MTKIMPHISTTPSEGFYFRPLTSADYRAYKKLRLMALSSKDNRYFVESSKPETSRTDDEWRKVCTEDFDKHGKGVSVAIGAFYRGKNSEELIGSALNERWSEDNTGQTAYYRAIFVHPNFRQSGIAEGIELMQDQWARKNGYNKAIFTIRSDKKDWVKRQIQVFGGNIVHTTTLPYVNGESAATHYLERTLHPVTSVKTQKAARPMHLPVAVSRNSLVAIAA